MSKYLTLPVGTYAVAMRKQGDPPATPPVLTTQVTVTAGGAYTIAGVGKFAGLGLKVYEDDLNRPTDGRAKVRVIQASVASPILDVGLADGTPVAQGINFASTTPYRAVSRRHLDAADQAQRVVVGHHAVLRDAGRQRLHAARPRRSVRAAAAAARRRPQRSAGARRRGGHRRRRDVHGVPVDRDRGRPGFCWPDWSRWPCACAGRVPGGRDGAAPGNALRLSAPAPAQRGRRPATRRHRPGHPACGPAAPAVAATGHRARAPCTGRGPTDGCAGAGGWRSSPGAWWRCWPPRSSPTPCRRPRPAERPAVRFLPPARAATTGGPGCVFGQCQQLEPVGEPTAVRIPVIGVESALEVLGREPNGELTPPSTYDTAGWYAEGVVPGDVGPAVLAGHVDSQTGPAVFFELVSLVAGDKVRCSGAGSG